MWLTRNFLSFSATALSFNTADHIGAADVVSINEKPVNCRAAAVIFFRQIWNFSDCLLALRNSKYKSKISIRVKHFATSLLLAALLLAGCTDVIDEPRESAQPSNEPVEMKAIEEIMKPELTKLSSQLIQSEQDLRKITSKAMTWDEFDRVVAGKWWCADYWQPFNPSANFPLDLPVYFYKDIDAIKVCSCVWGTFEHYFYHYNIQYKRIGDITGFTMGFCPLYINSKGELVALYVDWTIEPIYGIVNFQPLTPQQVETWEEQAKENFSFYLAAQYMPNMPLDFEGHDLYGLMPEDSRGEYDDYMTHIPEDTPHFTKGEFKKVLLGTTWRPVACYNVNADCTLTESESMFTNSPIGHLGQILCLDYSYGGKLYTFRKHESNKMRNVWYPDGIQQYYFNIPEDDRLMGFAWGPLEPAYLRSDVMPIKIVDGKLYVLQYHYDPWVRVRLLVCEPMSQEELHKIKCSTLKFDAWCFQYKFFD